MGGYDRVGCGGWASGGTYYYDCVFSNGGPNGVVGPPTSSPFNLPLPTTAPAPPAPPAPAPTPFRAPPVSGGGGGSGSGAKPAAAPTPTPGQTPTPVIATPTPWPTGPMIAAANPTSPAAGALALDMNSGQLSGPDRGSGLAALVALVVALGALPEPFSWPCWRRCRQFVAAARPLAEG